MISEVWLEPEIAFGAGGAGGLGKFGRIVRSPMEQGSRGSSGIREVWPETEMSMEQSEQEKQGD